MNEINKEKYDKYQSNRESLKLAVRTRCDIQEVRKSHYNRLGIKAEARLIEKDGHIILYNKDQAMQNVEERLYNDIHSQMMFQICYDTKKLENRIEKYMKYILDEFEINKWLEEQKGVGTVSAGWMLAEFDIYKADNVSKMWSFAGLNPTKVRGMKSVAKSDYKPEMGEIIRQLPSFKDKGIRYAVLTNELIRGDKKKPGFLCPYNQRLRAALLGVMGSGFIKSQNYYALNFYYPYKNRLENSDTLTQEIKKGGKIVEIPWKETTKKHRHQAAIRHMVQNFLKDLYAEWRRVEGLPVREPYEQEYLGKVHNKKLVNILIKTKENNQKEIINQ